MTISVVIFAILAGLIIGLVGAVLFIVTCVGFALIILLPTLFFTTAAATFIWLWGLAGYYILKKFNQKEIPGIHVPLKEGMENQLGSSTGEGEPKPQANGGPKENEKQPNGGPKEEKKGAHGKGTNGAAERLTNAGKSSGVDVGNPKEAADIGKHAGKATNAAQGAAGGATNAAGGAKGAVTGTLGI